MSPLVVFIKKELYEQIRNYKTIILVVIMLFLSISGPIMMKFLPAIMTQEGYPTPESTSFDSYAQFFKNVSQMFLFIIAIFYSGDVVNEFKNQTAIIMFSKGLSRRDFIIAKFLGSVIIVSSVYIISCLITFILTNIIYNDPANDIFLSFFLGWLFLMFVLAMMIFVSVFTTKYIVVLGSVIATIIWFYIISIFPHIGYYLPTALATYSVLLINDTISFHQIGWAFGITTFLIFLAIFLASYFMAKREM